MVSKITENYSNIDCLVNLFLRGPYIFWIFDITRFFWNLPDGHDLPRSTFLVGMYFDDSMAQVACLTIPVDDSMAQVSCLTIPEPKNPNSEPEKTVEEEKFSMVSDDFRVLYILGFQPAFLGISVWGCCFQAYFSTSLGWDLDSIILPRPWMKCEICADLREKPLGHRPLLTNKVLWHHHSDSMRYKVRLKGVYQECWKMLYCFFSFRIAYNIFLNLSQ